MRIFEITDNNQTILSILGINKESLDKEYIDVTNLLSMLIRLRSPHRNQYALSIIENFENLISKIQENRLLDRTDPDIIDILNKIQHMQTHVAQLKSQLIF